MWVQIFGLSFQKRENAKEKKRYKRNGMKKIHTDSYKIISVPIIEQNVSDTHVLLWCSL